MNKGKKQEATQSVSWKDYPSSRSSFVVSARSTILTEVDPTPGLGEQFAVALGIRLHAVPTAISPGLSTLLKFPLFLDSDAGEYFPQGPPGRGMLTNPFIFG